jgi:Na+/H+ antiporter NhaD/arsenite permease-like protein
MNSFLDFIARLGIVRVLSVPVAMIVIMCLLFRLATPPENLGDNEGDAQRS